MKERKKKCEKNVNKSNKRRIKISDHKEIFTGVGFQIKSIDNEQIFALLKAIGVDNL